MAVPTWLAAADTEKKEPAGKQAAASSVQLLHQMQEQLKKQQAEIEKLQAQLQQSREALLKAQQKIPEGAAAGAECVTTGGVAAREGQQPER